MTAGAGGDGLAAALIQISAHAERISGLDAREAGHYEQIAARLRDLAAEAASASTRIDGIGGTLDRQAAIIDALYGLDGQVAALALQLAELADDEDRDGDGDGDYGRGGQRYRPVAVPRWWKLTATEREAAVDRLRAWVEQVYRPGYGKLAAALPPCWERHPLCLFILDWLSELWSVLYLAPRRDGGTLAAQGEWQTRLLPAAAEQMAHEAAGCQHAAATWQQPRGPAPGPSVPGNGTRSGP